MSHLYQISLSCVIGHQMCHRRLPTTDFQWCREGREGRVGQKVLSKPSADSFAVGRRQKAVRIDIYLRYNLILGCGTTVAWRLLPFRSSASRASLWGSRARWRGSAPASGQSSRRMVSSRGQTSPGRPLQCLGWTGRTTCYLWCQR
jgi:hypothetical protein